MVTQSYASRRKRRMLLYLGLFAVALAIAIYLVRGWSATRTSDAAPAEGTSSPTRVADGFLAPSFSGARSPAMA